MTPSLPPELVQLLARLRRLSEVSVQDRWFFRQGDTLTPAAPNEKGYLVWEKGRRPAEFIQKITVLETVNGYPTGGLSLRLALTWWAEAAEIYVNGEFMQGGDLFDSKTRILLTPNAQPGQIFSVTLKLISPGHDIGGLMESRLIFEKPEPELEPGFIADEFTVLGQYLARFAPEKLGRLSAGLEALPWERVGNALEFDRALAALRECLKPLGQDLKRRSFHLLAHAHLDLAWLWPLAETWEAAERTFRSVLSLQQEFPDLVFGHTSPALYEWMERNRPELFEEIKTAVQNRRWELLGGMWVEPDVNLPGAESLVRQLLYGQRYFLSRFGQLAQVAWLPDSFGFCQQLPQLFKQAGIEVFFTGKLHWNDTNPFPHGIFNWRAPDGTDCLTLMSPPNVAGVMDTQPRPMADYGLFWEEQTGLTAMLWLPGVGDHGGGPSRDMWEVKRRWQNSDFFPEIKTSRAEDYVHELKEQQREQLTNLPLWTEDLYLELHRGCYTTHAEQKKCNRRSEYLLYEAELWSSFAAWFTGAVYPQGELESAWKKVLLNQFHDILPGTSIPDVFEEANADWSQILKTGEALVNQALETLSSRIQFPAPPHPQAQPLVVFNSLNQTRSEVFAIPYPAEIFDLGGKALTTQFTPEGETLFPVDNVPVLGYQSYWVLANPDGENLTFGNDPHPKSLSQGGRGTLTPLLPERDKGLGDEGDRLILDNGILKVTLDTATGEIASLYDYRHQREVLGGNGNQLQFFQDQGQYWDAWNIDPDYQSHPLESAELTAIKVLENGPLRWRLRVEKSFRNSRFQQDYVLEAQSPALKIINQVNWQERRVLVKVAFPLSFS
ncbi:MAG: alpha-mannosidase, partial [Cyanobacteriota bacterium]